jgi:rubredoxin
MDAPSPSARRECKVCWHVYDPALGDPIWQIPPGTPFVALPDHWTCPVCSTTKDGFLLLSDD